MRAISFLSGFGAALVCLAWTFEAVSIAQFPGAPAPGGAPSGPVTQRPSYSPQPARPSNEPSLPRMPGSSYQPQQPGSPYRPTPGSPGYRPGAGHAGIGPQVPQPGAHLRPGVSSGAEFNRHTDPRSIDYRHIGMGAEPAAGPQWREAQQHFSSGNVVAGRRAVDAYLAKNNSLDHWMNAVSAMERNGAPREVVGSYRSRAYNMAQEQMRQNPNNPLPWAAMTKFALDDGLDFEFRTKADGFIQQFPNDKYANYFYAVKSIQDEDWRTAERSLRRAKELGMTDEGINQLLKMVIDKQRWVWQFAQISGVILAIWLAGLALLYGAGRLMSKAALRAVEDIEERDAALSPTLRKMYGALIYIAGIYYYISLPMLVLLAVALPLSIGYALLHLPSAGIVLVAIVLFVGLGGVITALSGLRTCFLRIPREAPGKQISPEAAPELWRVAREVAEKVGTRPVDEIRLLPSADLAVAEFGGYWERVRDGGQRVLVIGLRLLQEFDETAFRCVLAHEYGHFLNRDTAGGGAAMRISASMDAFAQAIVERGPIRPWDVSVHFLRFFHLLFHRLTFGASRLQEIRADDVAVINYGPVALKTGLLHSIRSSLEYDLSVSDVLKNLVRGNAATANFIAQTGPMPLLRRDQLESVVRELFNAPTTEDDTHPSPADRFRLAQRHGANNLRSTGREAAALLPNSELLLAELSRELYESLKEASVQYLHLARYALRDVSNYLRHGNDPAAYLQRASIYFELGELDKALLDLEQIPPGSLAGYQAALSRAEVYKALNDAQGQIATLENLVSDHADARTLENYLWLGDLHASQGRHANAMTYFTLALEQQPNSVGAFLGRARVNVAQRQYQAAARDYQRALECSPSCPEARRESARLSQFLAKASRASADANIPHGA